MLSRKLQIPTSTLSYHLNYLQKRGLITTKSDGKYTLYYVTNNIGNGQKKMLQLLRQETPRNIITFLLLRPCASRIELSKSLGKHPTTLDTPLKKLLEMNIIEPVPSIKGKVFVKFGRVKYVERKPIGKEIIYRIKDCYSLYDSVILYQKRSLDDNFCDILPVFYNSWTRDVKPYNKLKSIKYYVEEIEKAFYEICPHPYHI